MGCSMGADTIVARADTTMVRTVRTLASMCSGTAGGRPRRSSISFCFCRATMRRMVALEMPRGEQGLPGPKMDFSSAAVCRWCETETRLDFRGTES